MPWGGCWANPAMGRMGRQSWDSGPPRVERGFSRKEAKGPDSSLVLSTRGNRAWLGSVVFEAC